MTSTITRLSFGNDVLTTVQYLAWTDVVLFFVLLGPMILVLLATNGVDPSYRPDYTIPVFENGAIVSKTLTYSMYVAERGMTEIEYKIDKRARVGCQALYTRSFPDVWDDGQQHLIMAAISFFCGLTVSLLSAYIFLRAVPSRGSCGNNVPSVHLLGQFISVTLTMIGCWQLNHDNLCFLEHVWPKFGIQTGILVLSCLMCFSYKGYEILLITIFLKVHLHAIQELEDLLPARSPSQEILSLMAELHRKIETPKAFASSISSHWEPDSEITSVLTGFKSQTDSSQMTSNISTTLSSSFFDSTNFSIFSPPDTSTLTSVSTADSDSLKSDGLAVTIPVPPRSRFSFQ